MGRPRRSEFQTGWHHVMNRGVDHQSVFFDDVDRVEFGRLLGEGHDRFGVEVHAYCLMTNHFHLLLRCPDGELSASMQHLGAVFTRHVNERLGRDGPLFRGRFTSRRIDSGEYLRQAVRYIHRNPLDIASPMPLETYRWSSHRTYLGYRRRPPWLHLEPVLDMFDGDVEAFHAFVTRDQGDSVHRVDVGAIPATVELALAERDVTPRRASQGLARTVSLLILDQLDGADRDELAATFGFAHDRSRQEAIWRARRLAKSDAELVRLARRALQLAV